MFLKNLLLISSSSKEESMETGVSTMQLQIQNLDRTEEFVIL